MMRFIDIFGACADSVYQALLFPPPREARASPYAGKIGTGDEATCYYKATPSQLLVSDPLPSSLPGACNIGLLSVKVLLIIEPQIS